MNALGDEAELGAALHAQRCPLVVREHEDRHVIWRLVAPPALPVLVRPRAANGTEHVSSEYPRSNSLERLLGNPIVYAGLTLTDCIHLLPHSCVEEPLH